MTYLAIIRLNIFEKFYFLIFNVIVKYLKIRYFKKQILLLFFKYLYLSTSKTALYLSHVPFK